VGGWERGEEGEGGKKVQVSKSRVLFLPRL